MASSEVKHVCVTCRKSTGVFICGGCRQVFCSLHANEHRQTLGRQMDEVVLEHDQLRQSLIEQKLQNPWINEIDEWEQQTIAKIRQMADDARWELIQITEQHRKHIETVLQKLTDQLNRARNEDDFMETDLKQWSKSLDELKRDLAEASTISIRSKDDDINSSISRLRSTLMKNLSFKQLNADTCVGDNEVSIKRHVSSSHKYNRFLSGSRFRTRENCLRPPRTIELSKTQEGLGFTVTGGREKSSLIYISRIIPNGVAWKHGGLKKGDQLLSVNGVSVENEYHEKAVELLRQAQGSVKLVVRYSPQVLIEMENRFEEEGTARKSLPPSTQPLTANRRMEKHDQIFRLNRFT